jgi:hypothetical protein
MRRTNIPAAGAPRSARITPGVTASIAALATALIAALTTGLLAATPAHASERPASGTFSWATGPGILRAWDSAGISLVGVSPGSVITNATTMTARVNLPVVAKSSTANATAGGFRFVNTQTGVQVRCSVPTVDTRARVVDCVLPSGYNAALFEITAIDSRTKVNTATTLTTIFQDMQLRIINREMANRLNNELKTTVFSSSVVIGNGSLIVSRSR